MYKEDEEEYKKRLERAKILRSSMGLMTAGENSNSNTSIQYDNEYINRLNRAKQLRNSVGMITTEDSFSQDISNNYEKDDYNYLQDKYDMEKTRENIGNTVLNAAAEIVKNPFAQAKVPAKKMTTSEQTKRELTDEEKETIRNKINEFNNTNNQNINNNLNENKSDNNVNIATQLTNKGTRLATQNELNNAQPISNSQIDATIEADKLNKQIKKGGKDAFEAYMETIGNNIFAGLAKKPIAGLANVVTTIAGFGVKGLENWAKLLNFNEVGDSLNNAYSDIIDFGKKINEKANYESVLTSQIEDDFTRGSGQVTDVISNMIGNQAIGYAIGIPGTAVQGLTVGGSSAQEVLNENKNNIGQATITGLAKGYTSYLTEKMFDANILTRGESNSISKLIDKEISKKISSNLGKELANKTIGIVGENLEELVEDNVDNIIDKLVNNKDLPDFKQWWENTKETAKVTTISTIIMNLIGLGGETFNNKEMDIQTENWVTEAKKIINQENMAIHYDPRQVKSKNTMEQFYITQFNQEGQIENIEPTLGKEIKNIQPQLMITPVIVKDINTNLYEVIDGATGVVLDNDYYNSIEEAEQSYNEKVKNISDNRITNINNTINEANYIIKNNLMSVVTQIQEQLPEIAEQYYQNNNSNSTEFNQNKNTDVFNNETPNYTTENVKTEYEQNNENKTPEKSKFYEDKPNYVVSNINEIETELNKKNSYSLEQIGETWSDIQENTYDLTLDDNMYVELEENNGKLEAVLYDGSTEEIPEINRVTVEKTKNGRYTAEAINNAVKEVATVQDENSPIQGQVDIEGNIVKQSSKNIDNIKDQLHNRIQNAIINKKSKGKTYLGDISDKVKNRIKKLLNIDVTGRRHVLADNDIRHMIKEHGDEKKEKTKGQIPITLNDIEKIPDILNSFDKIIIGNDNKEGKTIRYVKNYTNNVSYVVEVVPEEGKVLKIKTMWKKPVRVTNSQKTPSSTSKTKSNLDSTTSVTNSIPQNNKSVKNDENTISNKYIQNKRNNTNIQDFGEKIGGARKDLSTPRTNTKPGKEVIHDYTVEKADNGYSVNFKGKVLNDGFKTQAEAEQYILDFKNNIKNNRAFVEERNSLNGLLMTEGNKYLVYLRNPRTLKSQYTGKSFANKQDAENYAMALSMYLKENGKNLFRPQIQKVERTNANNKNATKATGDDILNNFGFKGGEFGNWVTQNERQQFLNYAQDAFTDLAAALDITSNSLGQQGAMSIAFGARGQGLTGAVAHFEPGKKVINMTRLKGAGSLAHEYGHSIDNYLSRVGGYNEDGMATENLRNPKLSDNMKNAIKEVTDAMKYNISTNQEEIDKKNAIYEKGRKDSLETHLSYLDNVFNGNQTTYKYNRKTKQREQTKIQVTDKQKQRYQDIRKILLNGDLDSKRTFVGNSLSSNNFEYGETIENLKSLYKEVVGRKINDDTIYWLYRYGQPAQQVSQIKSESAYSKSAKELDKETGRATAYFSRTDEMWARAFESYISDKLKAKGIKDTYLVHSVNNNEYALFNPFPAGEERRNINKAFDNLIQTMKDEGLFTSSRTPQNIDEDTGIRYMKKSTGKTNKNKEFKQNLAKQFEEMTGDTILLAGAKLGGIELRNKQRDIGTLQGEKETNPYSKEAMKIYRDYHNSQKTSSYLYHATSRGRLESIMKNGLTTGNEQNQKGVSATDRIYLSANPELAESYATADSVLLRINPKFYDSFENFEQDFLGGTGSYSITNNIPANMLQIKENGKWVSLNNINNTETIRLAKNNKEDTSIRNAERGESYIEQEIQKIEQTGDWDNSIPITKLTDIRKTIEDYLGLGIKKGHFRQDAYALYKGNNDVIRTKEYKDMDSILHETGHAIDIGKRLKIDKELIADELLTSIDKLGGYEEETRTIKLEEGFAEIIREYSIVPEQAKAEYPQTIAILEGLRKTDKKFNDFITKVQQQSYNYIHQNPRNRTLSNMSVGEQTDKQRITKNLIKQEVMRNIYDKDWAVKSAVNELAKANGKTVNQVKASENAYYLTRLASGISDKVVSMLSDGYIDEKGNKLFPGLGKIGEILGDNPERYNDHRASLVANRDVDYRAKTLKTGLRNMDTKAVREQFKNDTQIQQANKLVYDTLNGVMQYAVDNGLISQENAESLKQSNTFYIPMQRVIENRGNQVGRKGAVADIIKQRTGSELDVKDVYENIIANSSNIIRQVENNNILKAFYKEGQATGLTGTVFDVIDAPMTKIGTQTLEIWEKELQKQGVNTKGLDLEKTIDLFAPNKKVDAQNLITSFIDDSGKRIYLQFNDEILFNSLMNMDKKFMSHVLKINSKMNMPLRYGATMANLGFAIPNMISDTAQAAVYSTAGFIPVVDNALGVLDILAATNKTVKNFVNSVAPEYAKRINNLYSLYQQSGATSSTRMSQYRESTQNLMADVYGTKSKTLGIKEKYKPLKRLLDVLTYLPEISEQSTRFRVFEKNYEMYKNKGTAETDARILAALESRDATQDFGRTGNITREINQLIPFSAARVGSAYTFTEKIKANPKQVGLRIAILTAIAMGIKAIGYDDKEIEELNQRKKDDNFVMKIGDDIVTIKKPQGILRSIINLSEYIQDLATNHIEEGKETDRAKQWLSNAIVDNLPADFIPGTFIPNVIPTTIEPLIENAVNKDFYYNTDIVKSYDQDLPDSEQYYEYNSQLAIWLGKIFNYSPAKIDNLISGYFGGLGTSVTNTIDYSLGKLGVTPEKPEMGAEQNAIGKRFIVNVNSNSSSIDEIYNRKTELTKKQNGGTISSKEEKELEKIKAAISNMSDLNKQIKEIKKDLTMSGTEKADKIRVLQQEKTDTARQALGKDLIHSENKSKIQSTQFYPNDTIKKNGYSLTLNSTQKKEYEQIANEFYLRYEKQGIYSKEKLEEIKSKAKEYAKNQMFQKYRSNLVKTK